MIKRMSNERAFFRVNLKSDMCGKISIININGIDTDERPMTACIKDLGIGGMRIKSKVKFPASDKTIFKIEFRMYDKTFSREGKIVWRKRCEDSFIEYGFEFLEEENTNYISVLNRFSIDINKEVENIYKECRYNSCSMKKISIVK